MANDTRTKPCSEVTEYTQAVIAKEIACYRQGGNTEWQHRKQSGVPSISHLNKEG